MVVSGPKSIYDRQHMKELRYSSGKSLETSGFQNHDIACLLSSTSCM